MVDVSIIIPIYNGEEYVDKCISRLLSMDHGVNIEIIAINDCSSDGTLEKLNRYKDKIKIISNLYNKGPAFSRNEGIKLATGKYITLLDIDDNYSDGRLLSLYKKMEQYNMIICSDYNVNFDESGRVKSVYPNLFYVPKIRKLTLNDFVRFDCGPLQPMIKLSFLRENNLLYNDRIKYSEDFDLYFRIVTLCKIFYLVKEYSYNRLIHKGSLSTNRIELYRQSIKQTWKYINLDCIANKELYKRLCILSDNLYKELTNIKIRNTFKIKILKVLNLLFYKIGK